MNLKHRVLGAATTAILAGSLIVAAAPAVHAFVPTPIGGCGGLTGIGTLTPPLAGNGANTALVAAAKDAKVGTLFEGIVPATNRTAGPGQSCAALATPAAVQKTGAKLSGIASCLPAASTPPAQLAAQYPLNGKLGIKPLNQGYIRVQGFDPAGPDVIDLTGIVTKGTGVGATIGGAVAFDPIVPVAKTATVPAHFAFDAAQVAAPCGTPTGGAIGLVFIADSLSLLGNLPSGINFSF